MNLREEDRNGDVRWIKEWTGTAKDVWMNNCYERQHPSFVNLCACFSTHIHEVGTLFALHTPARGRSCNEETGKWEKSNKVTHLKGQGQREENKQRWKKEKKRYEREGTESEQQVCISRDKDGKKNKLWEKDREGKRRRGK